MATLQGPIDHPSYLTRQILLLTGKSTAGANTVQTGVGGICLPYDVRIRNAVANVSVAGTSSGAGNQAVLYIVGTSVAFPNSSLTYGSLTATGTVTAVTTTTTTATIGTVVLGSSTAGSAAVSGDMNVRLPAGQALLVKNGTDATGTYSLSIEFHLDPATAGWTGTN